jgi:hypothetical protein
MDRGHPTWNQGGYAPAVRRVSFLVATVLLSGLPFACTEDFSGGGGLPGDFPRAEGDTGSSDAAGDRNDARETETSLKDTSVPDTFDSASE